MEQTKATQRTIPFDLREAHMVARQVSDRVFAVMPTNVESVDHSGTNAGFIIGDNAVLAIESLSNGHLASQLIAEIRRRTSLPVRYLINTSFHGDHCFGNFVFPSETVVISHEYTKNVLNERFEEERSHMIEFMGEGLGLEDVVCRSADLCITDSITVLLGCQEVTVRHPGFIQTDGDLVTEIAQANVIFVGNALQAPPPAFAWIPGGRAKETSASYRRLYDRLNDETIIVSGHGKLMKRNDINYSIQYLQELDSRMSSAVNLGMNLEEAKECVKMEKYSDYSLYELAHLRVNVPALFSEYAAAC